MARISDYATLVRTSSQEGFVEAHAYPFLLLLLDESEAGDEWRFKTTTIASRRIRVSELLTESEPASPQQADLYRVFAIVKNPQNAWSELISVGRAGNNDIALPHRSVSKLHAHFQTVGRVLQVTDAGSRNGTRVNDRKVAPSIATPTRPGDTVTFGGVTLTLVDPDEFYRFSRKQLGLATGPG